MNLTLFLLKSLAVPLFIYACVVLALVVAEVRGDRRAQKLFKPTAALGFILLALMSGALSTLYGQIILAALVLCAVGDVALLARGKPKLFLLGMAAFALGHGLLVFAFAVSGQDMEGGWFNVGLYAGLAFSLILAVYFWRYIRPHLPADMKVPVMGYMAIIFAMILLAFSVGYGRPLWGIAAASALFATSDIFVARDRFISQRAWHPLVITPLYFAAQVIFALSIALQDIVDVMALS